MAEVRLRQRGNTRLKTLDRAAIAKDHVVEHSLRTKDQAIGRPEQSEVEPSGYAMDHMSQTMRRAGYVAERGMIRTVNAVKSSQIRQRVVQELKVRRQVAGLKKSSAVQRTAEQTTTHRMQESQIQSTATKLRFAGNASRVTKKKGRVARRSAPGEKGKQQKLAVQQARKHAIRRLRGQPSGTAKGTARAERSLKQIALRTARALRMALASNKILALLLAAGAAIAVLIIAICIPFGAAMSVAGEGLGNDGLDLDIGQIPGLEEELDAGIGTGSNDMVKVAAAQIGNHGGRKFWSWYGFSSRVSWCACFVSWVGDKCGYIQSGAMPKFAAVPTGANWFRSHNRWKGRHYVPQPGTIIFFDWGGNGTRDHVGIVERCDGKRVYTIEGNTTDQVARRSYPVGYYEICGYGIVK